MSNIISFILLIASVGLFIGYTNPTYNAAQRSSATLVQYEQALSNSKKLFAEQGTLIAKLDTFNQSDIAKLETLLPDSVDSVSLIIELDSIASQFGMQVRDFVAGNQDQSSTLGGNTTPYGTLSLAFSTTASYPTFIAFLKALEDNLRLIDVNSISFSSASNNAVYDFSLGVNTYWLK